MDSNETILDDLKMMDKPKTSAAVVCLGLSAIFVVINPILTFLIVEEDDILSLVLAIPMYAALGFIVSLVILSVTSLLSITTNFVHNKFNFFLFRILFLLLRVPLLLNEKIKLWGVYLVFHLLIFTYLLYIGLSDYRFS